MQSVGVVASGDEQGCGGVGTDAARGQQGWAVRGDRVGDPLDEVVDLFGEFEGAPRQQVQGVPSWANLVRSGSSLDHIVALRDVVG